MLINFVLINCALVVLWDSPSLIGATSQTNNCPLNVIIRAPFNGDCRKYWECKNGTRHLKQCPLNLEFMQQSKQCVPPQRSGCHQAPPSDISSATITSGSTAEGTTPYPTFSTNSRSDSTTPDPTFCPGITNGTIFFPYPGNCRKFYGCFNGRKFIYSCPSGLFWNQAKLQCDFQYNVNCTTQISSDTQSTTDTPQSTDTNPCPKDTEEILYYPDPDNCEIFWECYRGRRFQFHCAPGLYWNPDINLCDYKYNVNCSQIIDSTTTTEDGPMTRDFDVATPVPKICPDYSEEAIFLPDPTNCSRFWECFRDRQFGFHCPAGLYWNEDIIQCDYPQNVDCRNSPESSTMTETDYSSATTRLIDWP